MLRLALAAAAALWCNHALAWDAFVKGPDVFGETTVLAGEEAAQSRFAIQCKSSGQVTVALIFPKKEFAEVTETSATLYIATSSAEPIKLDAKLRSWNDNYSGIVAAAEPAELMPIIEGIRDAKGKINAGAEVNGNRMSDIFSSSGSTAAMNKVIAGCKLSPKG